MLLDATQLPLLVVLLLVEIEGKQNGEYMGLLLDYLLGLKLGQICA